MIDPTQTGVPRAPADDRPKPLMSLGFWAMMALCVLCVLAGAAIVLLAPKLLAGRPEPRAEAPSEPVPVAAAPVTVPAEPAPEAPASPDVGQLTERVAALEGHEKTTA